MSSTPQAISVDLPALSWKVGFEIELMAPADKSRRDLAELTATEMEGGVQPFFHQQSEPSKVPGLPVFHNLTQGFKVTDASGQWLASFVDDLTLQADLEKRAAPKAGWYRILSDDERLLRLIIEQADPHATVEHVMEPIAKLFGTVPEPGPRGMVRVNDRFGATVAIAAPLPGERERATEIVTSPFEKDYAAGLDAYLYLARQMNFTIPVEGATHIHFDAEEFRSARAIKGLVCTLTRFGTPLKKLLKVNSRCSRLGTWPQELLTLVLTPGFEKLDWASACGELKALKLTKFCDYNIYNLITDHPTKKTVEIRVLPSYLQAEPILRSARLIQALFRWSLSHELEDVTPLDDTPDSQRELLKTLDCL